MANSSRSSNNVAVATPEEIDLFARARHARYFEPGVPYHVISRTRGNLFLLRPDLAGLLRSIVVGILSHAKQNFPEISIYALAVLSNHLHLILEALGVDPLCIADFIAFFKRELTRRWKHHVNWNDSIWGGYNATALVTPNAQLNAFDYVLGQTVKEGLVADPRDWPGFHCAQSLTKGKPDKGHWFNGTAYGKARHAELAKKDPNPIQRDDFNEPREFRFDELPALAHLDGEEYRAEVCRRVDRIVEKARTERGTEVLGPAKACAVDPLKSSPVPLPPWFEERRRMIVWDDPSHPEVIAYLDRYWQHQRGFKEAAHRWRTDPQPNVEAFPTCSFVPSRRVRPASHMEQNAA